MANYPFRPLTHKNMFWNQKQKWHEPKIHIQIPSYQPNSTTIIILKKIPSTLHQKLVPILQPLNFIIKQIHKPTILNQIYMPIFVLLPKKQTKNLGKQNKHRN